VKLVVNLLDTPRTSRVTARFQEGIHGLLETQGARAPCIPSVQRLDEMLKIVFQGIQFGFILSLSGFDLGRSLNRVSEALDRLDDIG